MWIDDLVPLTDLQKAYMADLRGWLGMGDGMAIPAFGPSGQHGYVGVGSSDSLPRRARSRAVSATASLEIEATRKGCVGPKS